MEDKAAAVVEEVRDHQAEDKGQDQQGLPVRLLGQPLLRRFEAVETRGVRKKPAIKSDHDRNDDADFNKVFEEKIGPS